MVYACYCIYNEEQFLRQSLQSIVPCVEKVIIIDGSWSTFPTGNYASTDKSKKIAQEICGDKLIWVDCPDNGWGTEVEKRNQYLNLVPDNEWFFVIDGDEVIYGDIKEQFRKIERNKTFHIGLIEVSFHTPYINGTYYNVQNGIGSFADTTNKNAKTFLNTIDSEEKFKKLPWIAVRGHRYSMYKKEPNMHYGQHHSIIWVGDESIFDRYGTISDITKIDSKCSIYLLNNVVIDDLKYLRKYNRWKMNMTDKTKRIVNDTLEVSERVVSNTPETNSETEWETNIREYKREVMLKNEEIKPIMIIRSPRDNPEIEENFSKFTDIDQLWIKHYPIVQANEQLIKWVKEHKNEYTHVIMTTDDVMFNKNDLDRLVNDLREYDFPILTGVCNFCTIWCGKKIGTCEICEENRTHDYLAATFTPLKDILNKGKYLHETKTPALSIDTYDFIPNKWREENPIIKEVYFHGIALTAIRMDIFLEMDGLHLYNKEKGISADDVNLAIECHNRGIPQFMDFRIFVRHYGGSKIYPNINVRSGSKLVFTPKINQEATLEEYLEYREKLTKQSIGFPSRPHMKSGETVFDNTTKRDLTQEDWDRTYGRYKKFIYG